MISEDNMTRAANDIMHGLPLVSVIVPTYNRDNILGQTLRYLFQQDYPNIETIVVDQTPVHNEQTERFLYAHHDRILWIRVSKPSLPNARNIGIRHANGDIIVFIDDDVIIAPSFVRAHVDAYSDPKVGGAAGRVVPIKGGMQFSSGIIAEMNKLVRARVNFSSSEKFKVDQAHGSNMSFRRYVLFQIGLFDAYFDGNSFLEETDTCFRIGRKGYQMQFIPEAWSIHLAVADGGCGNRARGPFWYYWVLHNTFLFALRHYSVISLPYVTWSRIQNLFNTDAPLLALIPVAIVHAVISHIRTKSLSKRSI